jgi:hypothetical protein
MRKEGENEEGGEGVGVAPAVYCTQINCIMIPDPERGKNCK